MSYTSYYLHVHKKAKVSEPIDYGYPTTFFDLTVVFSGELYYNINGQDIVLKKNDAILIPHGSMRIRYAKEMPVHYMSINYYSDGVEEKNIPLYIPNCRPVFKKALFLYDSIASIALPNQRSTLDCGVQLIIKLLKDEIETHALNRHIYRILEYIKKNLTEPMPLQAIADSVHLSVPYCCHLVKKELGVTISEIINRERIVLAQHHLRSGFLPLKEIPYACGFTDYSHFYRYFKKYTGMSPSTYK